MRGDYFKGFKVFKILQLAVLVIFAAVFFLYVYLDDNLRNNIYTNKSLLTICVFLWAFMIYNVVCIILDFYQLEGHIAHDNSLNRAVYTDMLTGIPNRLSVDRIFAEYNKKKDISKVGCAYITISNLDDVNSAKGRSSGNVMLVEFSGITERIGSRYGFVGRNNGNEFLAVIDNCDEDRMKAFKDDLQKEIDIYNADEINDPISFSVCSILNSEADISDFSELIKKLYEKARG